MIVILGELGYVIDLLFAPVRTMCESTVPAAPLVLPLLLNAPPDEPPAEETTARLV